MALIDRTEPSSMSQLSQLSSTCGCIRRWTPAVYLSMSHPDTQISNYLEASWLQGARGAGGVTVADRWSVHYRSQYSPLQLTVQGLGLVWRGATYESDGGRRLDWV